MRSKPRPRTAQAGWFRPLCRVACVVLAASALSGCIIAPYPYHPHYWYR
jgi:hypothetical protein